MGVAADREVDAVIGQMCELGGLVLEQEDGRGRVGVCEEAGQGGPLRDTVAGAALVAPAGYDQAVSLRQGEELVFEERPAAVFEESGHAGVAAGAFGADVGEAAEERLVDVVVAVDDEDAFWRMDLLQDRGIGRGIPHGGEGAREEVSGHENQVRLLLVDARGHVFHELYIGIDADVKVRDQDDAQRTFLGECLPRQFIAGDLHLRGLSRAEQVERDAEDEQAQKKRCGEAPLRNGTGLFRDSPDQSAESDTDADQQERPEEIQQIAQEYISPSLEEMTERTVRQKGPDQGKCQEETGDDRRYGPQKRPILLRIQRTPKKPCKEQERQGADAQV